MANDRAEDFHPVPAIRRARAAHALGGKVGAPGAGGKEHGPVTRTEVEKHKDGTAHVVAHHEDGHAEVHPHKNEAEAHEHGKSLMAGGGGGGQQGMEDAGGGSQDEAAEALGGAPAGGEGDGSDADAGDGAEECPHCGGKMDGGKCSQCGYEDKASAKGPEEEEEGEGY